MTNAELPDEVLEMLGISKAQLQVIDADEQRRQKIRDARLREQFRVNAADIAAEVGSFVDVQHASDAVLSRFTVSIELAAPNAEARERIRRRDAAGGYCVELFP